MTTGFRGKLLKFAASINYDGSLFDSVKRLEKVFMEDLSQRVADSLGGGQLTEIPNYSNWWRIENKTTGLDLQLALSRDDRGYIVTVTWQGSKEFQVAAYNAQNAARNIFMRVNAMRR